MRDGRWEGAFRSLAYGCLQLRVAEGQTVEAIGRSRGSWLVAGSCVVDPTMTPTWGRLSAIQVKLSGGHICGLKRAISVFIRIRP